MDYLLNGKTYSLSYQDLCAEHASFAAMTDSAFLEALPAALHLATLLCWFKELPASQVLADDGIIHQLVHLLHLKDEPLIAGAIKEIREMFDEQLALAP